LNHTQFGYLYFGISEYFNLIYFTSLQFHFWSFEFSVYDILLFRIWCLWYSIIYYWHFRLMACLVTGTCHSMSSIPINVVTFNLLNYYRCICVYVGLVFLCFIGYRFEVLLVFVISIRHWSCQSFCRVQGYKWSKLLFSGFMNIQLTLVMFWS
jgi:hypothetical protein